MSHFLRRVGPLWAVFCLLPLLAAAQTYTLNEELMYRINFGRTDDVKILLSRGADPNARNAQGDPALSVAIDRQDIEAPSMVNALLDKGANPNIPNSSQIFPIMRAVNNGQQGLVVSLLKRGAEYDIKNNKGITLLELAKSSINPQVALPIEKAIAEKKAYEDSLRSQQRFKTVMNFYRFHTCEYQYWNYIKSARMDPGRDSEISGKIDNHKNVLIDLVRQFQKYFPQISPHTLEAMSNDAAGKIFSDLDSMISNRNRADHGIGYDKDALSRCTKIAGAVQ